MASLSSIVAMSLCAAVALAQGGKFNFPEPPKDKSTPVQQRLAFHAPDGEDPPTDTEGECYVD